MFEHITAELADRILLDAKWKNPLLIPIPTSPKRRRERGFNPTEALCEEIKKSDIRNTLEYLPSILVKKRHTESQSRTHASRKERLSNQIGSMTLACEDAIRGRNIVLVDDVMTSGATLSEAARVLKNGGAKKIIRFPVAR